jgi:hypothetical protein
MPTIPLSRGPALQNGRSFPSSFFVVCQTIFVPLAFGEPIVSFNDHTLTSGCRFKSTAFAPFFRQFQQLYGGGRSIGLTFPCGTRTAMLPHCTHD